MSKNLIVFDSDSLCYLGGKDDTLEQILEKVDNKIRDVLEEAKADYYVLLVSRGKYFRHDISKSKNNPKGDYKSNRTYGDKTWVNTIKEYLIAKYKAVWYPKLEADDIAAWLMDITLYSGVHAYSSSVNDRFSEIIHTCNPSNNNEVWMNSAEKVNKILVAMDKDLLYSIPGKHLNFHKKLGKDLWGMEWVETSIDLAPFFVWDQMIIGDTSDHVIGIKGKGQAWCKKNLIGSLKEVQHLVFSEYISEYGTETGIYEFQKNYRMLHMLTTNEDYLREVGYIPELPEFQKVISNNNNKKIEF